MKKILIFTFLLFNAVSIIAQDSNQNTTQNKSANQGGGKRCSCCGRRLGKDNYHKCYCNPSSGSKFYQGISLSYLTSSSTEKAKSGDVLFGGNGFSISYTPTLHTDIRNIDIIGEFGFQTGVTATQDLTNFGNSLVQTPFTAKATVSSQNWKNFLASIGPQFNFKRFSIGGVAGVKFGGNRSISIDKYDATTRVGTIYSQKEGGIGFYWSADITYFIPIGTSGFGISIGGGVGNNLTKPNLKPIVKFKFQ